MEIILASFESCTLCLQAIEQQYQEQRVGTAYRTFPQVIMSRHVTISIAELSKALHTPSEVP